MRIRRASLYTSSIYFNTLLATLQGIIVARILSQFDMGYFSQVKLIMSYLFFSNIGIMNGLLILIPRASEEDIAPIKKTCFTSSLVLFAAAGLLCSLSGFVLGSDVAVIAGIIFIFFGMREIPVFSMRAESGFVKLSIFHFLSSVLSFALTIGGAYVFGLKGALWGFALYLAVSLGIGIFMSGRLSFGFEARHLKSLLKEGMQIYISYLLSTLKDSIEKFIMIFFIAKPLYAVYTIGAVMSSFLDILPSAVFQYLLPEFIKSPESWDAKRMARAFTIMTGILTVLISSSIYLFTLLIPAILPKYTESLGIFYILSFSPFIGTLNYLIYNKLISEGKMKYMYAAQAIGALFLTVIIIIVMMTNAGLTAVAVSVLSAKILYGIILLIIMRISMGTFMLRMENILVFGLSAGVVIMSIVAAGSYIHSILLFITIYSAIMYKVTGWKKRLR